VKGRLRRTVSALLAAGVTAGLLAGAAPAGAIVTKGTITPNRGAKGIKLGMTRAQVVARLGKPVYKNANGYMQYGSDKKNIVFDVYLDISTSPARVRLLGIFGGGFCLAGGGPCLLEQGGVGRLRDRYGSQLTDVTIESGETAVWLKGTYRGCPVFTDFGEAGRPRKARIGMVFIGFESGSAC
jgi:hypothetical protein